MMDIMLLATQNTLTLPFPVPRPPAPAPSPMEQAEDDLLQRAKHFDEDALGEVYDRYETKIYRFLYRRTGDPTLAEDLKAQVFLKMLEAIRSKRIWHSSFSGWLYRIAHNLLIDHYRNCARQRHVPLDETPVPSHRACPVAAAERQLEVDRLRSAMHRLTDDQALVISLRYLEHCSIAETARMLGKSDGAIKSLQHRALTTLHQLLENEELL